MDNTPPPTRIELGQILNPNQMQQLARLLQEIFEDSGHGKVTIIVYKKGIAGMDVSKTFRRGHENNNSNGLTSE